jgi:predicted transposase/invertase (TIGR01784 family)
VSSEKYLLHKGREKGREEGKKISTIDIAKNMLRLNFTNEQVILSTGLSESEVEAIRKEITAGVVQD